MYYERKVCIFCESRDFVKLFEKPKSILLGSYNTEDICQGERMPFNVLVCSNCGTGQTQYLGDLNEIYKVNHAFAFGSLLNENNRLFIEKILSAIGDQMKGIVEVGAGSGVLADRFMDSLEGEYTIIDPFYFGKETDRKVIREYIEKVDLSTVSANTMVISHVLEHLYEPLLWLRGLTENIRYIGLNFPDLETYVQKGTYHVLNPEHIYYVENDFLIDLFKKYGFQLIHRSSYQDHSVHFIFERSVPCEIVPRHKNTLESLTRFYNGIQAKVQHIQDIIAEHSGKEVYLWPCSIHNQYLFTFGLEPSQITGMLDNSLPKLNKYLYGTKLYCRSFKEVAEDTTHEKIILLNGGCFNKEITFQNTAWTKIVMV